MISKLSVIAAGLVLGMATLNAGLAEAFTLYNFSVTWADGVVSTGQVAINESSPDQEVADYSSALSYKRRQWNFLEFTMNHRGKTYRLPDLFNGYISQYEFPDTSDYFPVFGNTIDYLYAEVWENSQQSFTVHRVRFSPISTYEDYGPSRDYVYNQLAVETQWTRQPELPSTPISAVPEPTTALGLALAGVGLTARRWHEQRQ